MAVNEGGEERNHKFIVEKRIKILEEGEEEVAPLDCIEFVKEQQQKQQQVYKIV